MTETIPSPHGIPILGNVLDVDPEHPQESLARIAKIYGPIFRLRLPDERIFVANYALARDLFDEKKFQKAVRGPLEQVRNATKDGLFTAYPGEHNWEIAHRTLMPAFGPLSIRGMFPEMQDIVSQMVLKWARFGPDTPINVADDFTRLTLDSIALCAMGDRFNSFYHEKQHPFVAAMGGMLTESFARSRRPGFASLLYQNQEKQYQADIEQLTQTARELLESRRKNPTDKKDLLNALVLNKDPKTGEKLSDDAIIRNMITFLIAGHETTSGLLSFLFYELLENPEAYRKAQEEVDRVIGKDNITIDYMSKLPYLEACLRETLRLHPTAPGFSLEAKGDQVLDGRYTIKDGETINILLGQLHRDPEVYGSNAEEFRPSRMLDEEFAKLPPNTWKPFGNGIRACIGRPFAWQEALLAVATLLQVFQFTKNNASYQLQIKTTLTIKPQDFYMNARIRDPEFLNKIGVSSSEAASKSTQKASKQPGTPSKGGTPLLILYGSNTGTCEALANELATAAPDNGFSPQVKCLDSAAAALPRKDPIAIITASYEGQPPDNAAHFVEWLKATDPSELKDVRFAVFGVGNKEWHTTYQKIPIVVDEAFSNAGAERLTERLAADITQGNIFDTFNDWQDGQFWPAVRKLGGKSGGLEKATQKEFKIEVNVQTRSSLLRQDVQLGEVSEVRLLTKPGTPRKRHIGIRLPTGLSYQAGDYLAVLPLNPPETVRRVINRFRLPWDATITIDPSTVTSLPTGRPLTIYDILTGMVELGQAATGRATAALIKSIPDTRLAEELEKRAAQEDFQKSNVTLLDLLEDYPSATYTLGQFLASVPPMRLRQYSISSTPLASESECTLTYSVIDAPAKGSRQGYRFLGVASTYLERLSVGDRLHISLRPSRAGFHLPVDDRTPIIMACAGTGLAPFHAFVEERAIKKAGGIKVGPALLFYGCNSPDEDDMYRDEFDKWQAQGVVDVRRAYSHNPQASKNCKHIQDRIWADRDESANFFRQGAQIYICGAGVVGLGIEKAMARIRAEAVGEDEQTALKWVQDLKGDRYWADVFA
ncbi:bifunctional cytochrome P450/NADPH--P450 reductase [Aspergillus alliaceus]|uniref:bifunctional cytochrome P450/NADPH--P450 reductase n=1 Tax=Petromyces alliaceus TaxID=209559 RepID=UPI0012A5B6D2|nr:cytochrome P450 [Aspergillus alliaceus]KAB8235836.1 cytochrome P450 [Aspergillus alliaceus]